MHYGNTKTLIESIVRWLRTEGSHDDAEWLAQADLVQSCLAEMVEMAKPTVHPSKAPASRYIHRPIVDRLNRALPYGRSMLTAMRDRDRTTALEHGETTLHRL
jgi:hypothetical protein